MSNLHRIISDQDEQEFHLRSKDFFRLPLKQIGSSINEIISHFMSKDGVNIIPSKCTLSLKRIRDTLLEHLEADNFLYVTNIATGSAIQQSSDVVHCLAVILDSLALAMDCDISPRPSDVKCDVLLVICGQPVIMLTLVDGDKDSEIVTLYHSSVAKGVTTTLRKFMDDSINIVSGVLDLQDIDTLDAFKSSITTLAEDSAMFVTASSLTTSPSKYEKIVTAFWAGVAETRSIISKDGGVDTDYLRFLTKDQCIILMENINEREMEVQFQTGTGATTLMVEVARRLSRLGKTLLVCMSEEEKERLRKVYPNVKTFDDLEESDFFTYTNIVDKTGETTGPLSGKQWSFRKVQGQDKMEQLLRETNGVALSDNNFQGLLLQKINIDDEKEFQIRSKDFYRSPLKQIGNSILDIKMHFMPKSHINTLPTKCTPTLARIRDKLVHHLELDMFLYKKNTVTGSTIKQNHDMEQCLPGLSVIMDSLALAMDFEISPRPSDVKCDVLLVICGQPVIVLTLIDGDKDSEIVTLYHSSVAKGVTTTLRKFMDDSINIVSGVLDLQDIDTLDAFKSSVTILAEETAMFVTASSLTTSPSKYEKIVTAFWAGVAETRSIISKDDRVDTDYLRFLTKDQCIILMENINEREMEVQFQTGTGATTLMVEVAQRLARVDDTLLLCRSQEEKERLRSVYPNTQTLAGLKWSDLSKYTNIVDETGTVTGHVRGKLWRFVKSYQDIGHLQHCLSILEKQMANTESMINLFSFSDRVDKLAHLSRELETLKLIDISSHGLLSVFRLPNNVALDILPVKNSPSAEGSRDQRLEPEEYMHHVMDQLKVGIRGRSDLFPLLGSMIKQVKGIIPGLQDKVRYFEEETERRTETERKNIKDIHSVDHSKKRRDQRLENVGHKHNAWNQLKSNIERMKVQVKGIMAGPNTKGGGGVWRRHSTKVKKKRIDISVSHGVPGMKHNELSEETDSKHKTASAPVPDALNMDLNKLSEETGGKNEAQSFAQGKSEVAPSVSGDVFDSEETEELKKRLKTLEQEAYRRQQELNGLTEATGYGVEWEYNMDNLSEEMFRLRIQDVVIDVIGKDEIPVSSTKQRKPTTPYESDDDSRIERRDVKRGYVYQLRHLQHGTLKQSDIMGIVRQIITDDLHGLSSLRTRSDQLEHVYGGPIYIIGEIKSERSGPVSCPAMTLHKDRVYEKLDVSEDGHELTNWRESGKGHHSDQFKKYEGTCSGLIPLPSSPSTLTVPTYWETNTRVQGRSKAPWWIHLEMGVMEESQVDTEYWVYSQTRGWCVCVVDCNKHQGYCTQVWGERRQCGECLTDTLTQTPGTDVTLKYGVVVDIGRGRLAFIDLNRERVLYRFDVVFRDSLRPMLSVSPYWFEDVDMTMRLVSGSEVVMDDKKQKLIAEALFGRV